jgi:hypothetical protein
MGEMKKPAHWAGKVVQTLDVLLYVRDELQTGRPLFMFTGDTTLQSLFSFIQGYEFSLYCNERPDTEYRSFVEWLRDERQELPGNWIEAYLKESGQDHRRAVMKYLDFVAEYVALKGRLVDG